MNHVIVYMSIIECYDKVTVIESGDICRKLVDDHCGICDASMLTSMRLCAIRAVGVCMV